ncbi:hypothetical protein HNQ94_003063 [Salirhabdus euzebyi]|uniref:TRAP transporter solute receptor, TAXI family n=1 Tax=Salirhabdus euzebyi TaxID=394506 RepID=A0A841Q8C7_9BACI|nr:TAXI family TRAP transporter solute-binding subunit [Salirhabdus euzebyi]MBB6454574.1 hypothetical protein [Salirhabdus euzebyi]
MPKKILMMLFVMMLAVVATACNEVERRSIGTGGSGGVFYVVGAGMGNIVTNNSDSIELTAQSTAATTENLNLVDSGDLDFGFGVYDAAIEAYNGEGAYDRKYENLRLVLAGHGGYQHIIVRDDSDIQSIEDFEGKRIGIPPGNIGEKLAKATVEAYGLTLDDLEVVPLSFAEMSTGLKDENLDAAFVFAGIPASTIIELGTSLDIRFISQTDEGLDRLVEAYPYWFKATIPGSDYDVDEDIKTFLAPYVVFANKDVPDDVVSEFIDITFTHNDELVEVHPEGQHYTGNNDFYNSEALLPYHPGAEEYYKENNIID